ncbi:hypothetical protein ACROYT_G025361 [Oculina patagonica]
METSSVAPDNSRVLTNSVFASIQRVFVRASSLQEGIRKQVNLVCQWNGQTTTTYSFVTLTPCWIENQASRASFEFPRWRTIIVVFLCVTTTNIQKDSTFDTLVCSEHFKTDEIQTTLAGRKRLRDQAVPSVFAWTKTTQQRPENVFQRRKKLRFEMNASSDEEACKLDSRSVNSEPTAEEQLKNRIAQLEEQIAELEEQVAVLSLVKFGLKRFSKDPEQIKFYTGFGSYELLKSEFNWLQPYAKNMATWSQVQRSGQSPVDYKRKAGVETSTKCTLPLFDQFFLFLVRIKQGSPIEDLAVRYPSGPQKVRANLPDCFRATYPHTCVILDCTEIKVQTPSSKVLNSEFYSSYKSHTTYKGLVGITPNGAVSFVNSLFQGSISDKEITRQSGILDLLEEGTEVMADKGFLIDYLLNKETTPRIDVLALCQKWASQGLSSPHLDTKSRWLPPAGDEKYPADFQCTFKGCDSRFSEAEVGDKHVTETNFPKKRSGDRTDNWICRGI